ncbi:MULTISPECIES: helix-turn-helix domain-containing protein [Sinorhizobium]|nr:MULTISPECIES: helix-turn-helix transcriptional regulator [Sinorhizobium]WRW48867.1 helix-turn-helix transcriptional regulator [Sinorhizobium kummerowiae]
MNNTNTTSEVDVIIGSNIRRIREFAGVSKRGLAKAAGVSWSQMKKCEDGARRISAGSLFAVARALNCSIDEFWKASTRAKPRWRFLHKAMRPRWWRGTSTEYHHQRTETRSQI